MIFQAAEPSEPIRIPLGELRKVAEAYADFVDVKSTYYYGHSRKVAGLAFRAAIARGDASPAATQFSMQRSCTISARPHYQTGYWRSPRRLPATRKCNCTRFPTTQSRFWR